MEIIVAPKRLHKEIFSRYRKNPFSDIKVLSKEDLSAYVYPKIKSDAIFYMMENMGISYDTAFMYLEFLPYINVVSENIKIKQLTKIYNELEKNGFIIKPHLTVNYFRNNDVKIFYYSKSDCELIKILDILGAKPFFYTADGDYKENNLYVFNKIEDEVYFVLNKIASLIDSGIDINSIYILRRNVEYDYYIKKFSFLFGFGTNITNNEKIINSGFSAEYFKDLLITKDFLVSLNNLKEKAKDTILFAEFESLILSLLTDKLSFDNQLDYIKGSLKKAHFKNNKLNNVVNIIDDVGFFENKYIFVMGFSQGQFPRSIRDDKYLNNCELSLINRLNAKEKTLIDNELLLQFFQSNNNFVYSFSSQSLKSHYYISPLKDLIKLIECNGDIDNVYYSKKVLGYILADLKDADRLYNQRDDIYYKIDGTISIPYNTYSNNVKGTIVAYGKNDFIKLSTTSLKEYYGCPYSFYLSKKLKLEVEEDIFAKTLGTFAHSLMEASLDENFDFDVKFAELFEQKPLKLDQQYLLKTNLYNQLKDATSALKTRLKYCTNITTYTEEELSYYLNKNTVIYGRVDFVANIDNKCFICVDYKTGSDKFNDTYLNYGISSQLPTYAFLCKNSEKFQDLELAGIYINNILSNSTKNETEDGEIIKSYLKLNGKTIGDLNYVLLIDSTIADGKSSFISGVKMHSSGVELKGKGLISKEKLNSYLTTVRELYEKMERDLRFNMFEIKPLYVDANNYSCKYCKFKDICHVRPEQYVRLSELEEEE